MSRVQLPAGTERVLVVEDQDALRESLSVVLDRLGYDVYQASTEKEAKFVAGAVEIDLLITDVVIPSTCGVTVAGIVTDYRPDVPILYMSGYTTDEVLREHGEHPPGLDFLQKPFEIEDLVKKVRELLDGPVAPSPLTASA